MASYIARRVLFTSLALLVISVVSFIIIQLPPGDFLLNWVCTLRQQSQYLDPKAIEELTQRYGFDQPIYVQYYKWISGIILRGDWGYSLEWQRPVKDVLWERMALTALLSGAVFLVSWCAAIPLGVYSATHHHSSLDRILSIVNSVGAGTPGFMIALVIAYVAMAEFGLDVRGLFSQQYILVPWSWAKFVDLLKHLWVPVVIISIGSTAAGIRTMRANLLDELNKPYVKTARAKGLKEGRLVWKYPVRMALTPFFSTAGRPLAGLLSGQILVEVALSLPTSGPLMLRTLMSQDMYVAGSFLLLLSALTIIGRSILDILLAWIDPRIRSQGRFSAVLDQIPEM